MIRDRNVVERSTSVSPVVGRQPNDDVQDRTSTKRETQEKRFGAVMWEMCSAGHRQHDYTNRHKSKNTTQSQNTSMTMYDDNDDDDFDR